MDDKVFIYLRLRLDEAVLARSKIREFAGLGSLLAQFLRQTVEDGVELPEGAPAQGVQVLDYVDANTDRNLISFRVDPVAQVQVIEGCIPPLYQPRMLDPDASAFSWHRFVDRAAPELTEERKEALSQHLSRSQNDLIERIRATIDDEGRFEVRVPLDR